MALTTEPTDAEILDLWELFVGEPTEEIPLSDIDKLCFARAARRSWGQPSGAGEPVAWRYRMRGDLQWQYTERPEQFTHADEVQELTTPQPTQAQAGALPKSYQASVLTSNSHDSGCRVSFSFGSVAEAEAWHESLIDQRHGIPDGPNGKSA